MSVPEDLRQTIRAILMEELQAQGVAAAAASPPRAREERVSIKTDAELASFVRRVLDLSRDSRGRADIESGRHVFRLHRQTGSAAASQQSFAAAASTPGGVVSFDRGWITEKQINSLADGVAVVKLGGSARLTPLAKDAIRQGGIKLERTKT